MTDERRPDEPETPDQGTPPNDRRPSRHRRWRRSWTSGQAADDESDTTAQPTSSWTQPARPSTPPPIPPPAMPTPRRCRLAPQPAVSWAPAPAPVAATGKRTTLSLAAGILLILGGILGGLAGLAVAVFGERDRSSRSEDFGGMPEVEGMDMEEFMSGFVVFFGIIVIAYSLAYLFAGIGVVRSRDWGPRARAHRRHPERSHLAVRHRGARTSRRRRQLVGTLIGFGIHAYIVVALLFFWRTKPSTA